MAAIVKLGYNHEEVIITVYQIEEAFMSEQEMRNKIEFIVEQQAQFSIDLLRLQEEHAKAESRISRLEGATVAVMNMIGELTKSQRATDERVNTLAEKVDALTERLDAIIDLIVKRTLGENGETRKDGTN